MPRPLPIAGEPPPERADAARNRARILDAARDLFARRDPCSVSVDDIAEAADVGKGTIYRRFGDRARLMQAVLDGHEQAFQAAVLTGDPPLGPGAPPAVRVEAFLCALVTQLEEVGDLIAQAETGAAWQDSPPQQFRRLHLRVLIGQARPDLDAEILANILLAPLSALPYLHQRRVAGYAPDRIRAALCALARGVLAQAHP